ncbi:polysaccharide biosynthesis tyrosine autokinase [Staphylococcus sp. EZ-P03]|uniref:polysaccharide biosynthesis tyrosine autokinase n=1 Tax=Staphylococcus sp. EZ-P03 TaxID=2282739 RepID=UPI000DF7C4BE|nr:polysaccharide biosynthesis tyrosine autokinase [Staphylococcus sp. EZ-P03]
MFRKKKKHYPTNSLVTKDNDKNYISEQFKSIRSNLLFFSIDHDIQSIVVTSEKPEAGKSTIAANLAVVYAQAGYLTLLLDGDMRKPTQHYHFKTDNQYGLSSLITSNCTINEAITKTEVEGLDLITSGPTPPNPSELIVSQRFKNLHHTLNDYYDFVIIDTPPVNSVTDAQIFSEIAGNAVLVVDVENNNTKEIKRGKALIEKSGAKILGVILNKVVPEDLSYSKYY